MLASHGTLKEAGAFMGPAFAQGITVTQAELGNPSRTLLMALPGPLELPRVLTRSRAEVPRTLLPPQPLTPLCTFGQSKDKFVPGEGEALVSILLLNDLSDSRAGCHH